MLAVISESIGEKVDHLDEGAYHGQRKPGLRAGHARRASLVFVLRTAKIPTTRVCGSVEAHLLLPSAKW